MDKENKANNECESLHRELRTDNEIRDIKILISSIHTNSEVNKANLRILHFYSHGMSTNNNIKA